MKMGDFTLCGGPGRSNAESSSNDQVQESYKSEEKNMSPLVVHGTFVMLDWDSCIADEACIGAFSFQIFFGIEVNRIYSE